MTAKGPSLRVLPEECTILVVDDEESNRDLIARRLERKGFHVRSAADGPAALALLETEPIDLILLDIMMPTMSGIEVLHRVRRRFAPVELPVIMATARGASEDLAVALRLGANDYLVKPLDFEVLFARVTTSLSLRRANKQLAASEARYRLLAEQLSDVVLLLAPDGVVRYVSPACVPVLGFRPDELVGKPFQERLHRGDLGAMPKAETLFPEATPIVLRVSRQDGTSAWLEVIARVVRDEHSALPTEIVASGRDVSALVRAAVPDAAERLEARRAPVPPPPRVVVHGDPVVADAVSRALREASSEPPPRRKPK